MDILLGADHHELMYSMKEVVGEQGQPSARLCPLGWTAFGKVNGTESNGSNQTDFHHTYFFYQDKPLTFIKQIGILMKCLYGFGIQRALESHTWNHPFWR